VPGIPEGWSGSFFIDITLKFPQPGMRRSMVTRKSLGVVLPYERMLGIKKTNLVISLAMNIELYARFIIKTSS
jgi:hypothetical protein